MVTDEQHAFLVADVERLQVLVRQLQGAPLGPGWKVFTGTIPFNGSDPGNLNIASITHGLGVVPTRALVSMNEQIGSALWMSVYTRARTETTIQVLAQASGPITGDAPFTLAVAP